MNKRIISIILTFVILCITILPVSAKENYTRLYDGAGLLTEKEAESISSKLDEMSKNHQYDILIITESTLNGNNPAAAADDFYNAMKSEFKYENIIFLFISMEENNRNCSVFPYGNDARSEFTNDVMDNINNEVTALLADSKYGDGFNKFITLVDDELKFDLGFNIIISVGIGLLIAFICVSVMKGKLKSVRSQSKADNYLKNGSLNITNSRDYFLYRTVTKTKKESNNSSGSSRSTSSGGTSGRTKSF